MMLCVVWTVSGDELNALGDSWMFILWTSDLSPCPNVSTASRFPICILPASLYAIDDNGVNLTLQHAARVLTDSFNKLSTEGIKVRDLASLGGGVAPCFNLEFQNPC